MNSESTLDSDAWNCPSSNVDFTSVILLSSDIHLSSSREIKMQRKALYGILLVLTLSATLTVKPATADTLTPNDFKLKSFSKTVDFFDFARSYAAAAGKPIPPSNWHAYLYQTYINTSGFQLYYSGLVNITAGTGALTIPVQSFIEHYKTPNGKDVLTSSSFIMLLAFNDTATSKHPDSPDLNDNLYASFSLGLDLTPIYGNATKPALSSKTEIIPLTSSNNELTWTWGMRYTNLTAVWWRMWTDPANPRFEALPIAITTYDELTFTYQLDIDPNNHTATVTGNYVIGRMTNLWLIRWLFIIPVVVHYNATGAYTPNGKTKISNENIYQFLDKQHIKMSIVLFQNSLVLGDIKTQSSHNNQNVTDAEVDVGNGEISTKAGNEEIFKTDFGTKATYQLYNYTADPTETEYTEHDAVARTAPRPGYAKNPLFSIHVALLRYVPLIVQHMAPALYQKAKEYMLNMTYADYFYLISYPEYSGFKVKHDPTYTAYIGTTAGTAPLSGNWFGLLLIGGIIAVIAIAVILVMKRRGAKTQTLQPPTQPTATS
ncbi:MAG TPA: hypothetical protein VJ249_07615 [Candidatus Bathyarchaeia archaeon]|nr:hypothetical protein [Candidatus Bathyarchaeia archaeon]